MEQGNGIHIETISGSRSSPKSSVNDRLLAEMKGLRDKYNTNYLELQNVREKVDKLNTENSLRQQKGNIEKTIIGSLISANADLSHLLRLSEKVSHLIQSEYEYTHKRLDEAKNKIGILEKKLTSNSTNMNESKTYEVEKLVDHKMVRKQMLFKVRWKGYTSKYDTWEKETSLSCPGILKAYRKSRRLKN